MAGAQQGQRGKWRLAFGELFAHQVAHAPYIARSRHERANLEHGTLAAAGLPVGTGRQLGEQWQHLRALFFFERLSSTGGAAALAATAASVDKMIHCGGRGSRIELGL